MHDRLHVLNLTPRGYLGLLLALVVMYPCSRWNCPLFINSYSLSTIPITISNFWYHYLQLPILLLLHSNIYKQRLQQFSLAISPLKLNLVISLF